MNLKISRAVKQPFTGANWPMKLAIGALITLVASYAGALGMLGGFIKVALTALTAGYALRIMSNEAGSNGNLQPILPEWNEFGPLFTNGITSTMINAAYALVFALVVGLVGSFTGAAAAVQSVFSAPSLAALATTGGVFLIGTFVVGLFYALTLVMLNVHYAVEGRIRAFIEFGPALRRAFSRKGNLAVAAITSLLIIAVSTVIGFIPVVGAAVGSFVASVALANLWAQVYRQG
ncbi:MAG TPA: DUF4013 domain-containing protein [Planktothrix sp.]|jgi:hypothetical protein